jgi:uncharacterized protein YcfJ
LLFRVKTKLITQENFMGKLNFKAIAVGGALLAAMSASAQITFYEHEAYGGRAFRTQAQVGNFERYAFNDRASSVIVERSRWEVCEDSRFGGQCVVLRPGRYPSLQAMGFNDRVSSVRPLNRNLNVNNDRYAPEPGPTDGYYRAPNERLYEANVISVRAVVGPTEQRCWVEREQVNYDRSGSNVPGAVLGAVIGGVLGHQIGGGSGRDIATAGGAVAGAAIGSNQGRNDGQSYTQNVRRCEQVQSNTRPEYWDVTYSFRGQQHRMQTRNEPGPTVTVNSRGEPRV